MTRLSSIHRVLEEALDRIQSVLDISSSIQKVEKALQVCVGEREGGEKQTEREKREYLLLSPVLV